MAQPRIAPVTPEETDDRTKEILAALGGGMSSALNIFTTLALEPVDSSGSGVNEAVRSVLGTVDLESSEGTP